MRFIVIPGQVLLIVAMLVLLVARWPALVLCYSAERGASSGLWMVSAKVARPSYFGRRHLGSIRGLGYVVGVVGPALGPIPFGQSYDYLGGYIPAIADLLILPVLAVTAVSQVRPLDKVRD